MGQVVFAARAAAALGFGEELVDLAVAHVDAVVHLALAKPLQLDLLAHFVAEFVEGHAVLFQFLAKRGQRHFVVFRDAFQRPVELDFLHPNAVFLRQL